MKQYIKRNIRQLLTALCLFALSSTSAIAYDVWLGLPYFPKGADSTLKDQWELTAPMLGGLNPNLSQTKTPVDERNTTTDWKNIIQLMPTAKNNAMFPMPRTHFNYGTRTDRGTLAEYLVRTFKNEPRYGYKVKWVMPFDNQPGEDRTLPIQQWTDAQLQELRDWLDNNGHANVRIITNVRNNGAGPRANVQKAIMEGYSIEARATLWFENNGRRQDFLKWALSTNSVKDKHVKFQMPFGRHLAGYGFPTMDGYQAMRVCMRWLVADVLEGDLDFIRRDDVTFMSIVYDPGEHFPEKSVDGTAYENTVCSVLLSIMEQQALFDGTAPGGLITEAQAMSYDRIIVPTTPPGPDHGLVAHWSLDEGTGDTAEDATGYSPDGTLRYGASWGSDATRDSYVSFDGNDDRIDTGFTYALSDTDDFTWAWWANKQSPSNLDGAAVMVGNRYGGTGSESSEFIKMTARQAEFTNGSSENYNYADIATGGWHHYAMVKSGTSYQWYVDGVAEGPPVTINYNETSPLPFKIGGDDDDNTPGGKEIQHFQGYIDDVLLYRSALTQQDIANVINGNYDQTITMVTLGTPADSTAGSTWSDGAPAHGNAHYTIPATGNLRGESGTSTFPGTSLTVEAGGKFQVRALDSSDEATTVDNLILSGGAGFGARQFAELAAGTGNNEINLLNGTITQSGATRLVTYGGSTNRRLKVASRINGSGTLQLVGEGAIIDNEGNTFSGTWEVATGATLTFYNAGSVGSADIDVENGGHLIIQGNWDIGAELTVADASNTTVDLGNYAWTVSNLIFGGSPVTGGIYTASALNALGSNAVFTGSGIIRVLPPGTIFKSASFDTAGTTSWICPEGVTSIQVECWGGGGAGGSSSTTGAAQVYVAGGGGAGGAYARKSIIPVTPGNAYPVTIAPAAVALSPSTASTGDRVNGADISFTGDNSITVLAKGGQGGQCVINPAQTQGGIGGAGTTTGSISDGTGFVYAGGDGYFPPTKGGSGGGGAGNSEDGGDGYLEDIDDADSASLPGAGGEQGGGEGGTGAANVGNGGNGFSPGGGGGGARTGRFVVSSGADLQKVGGNGGLGKIIISYIVLPDYNTVDPNAPIAHWKLDDGNGKNTTDSSGNGHTGSLLYGANWSSDGTRESFVSFDGNDDRISTSFTYALSSSDDFTWAWWAKQQSTSGDNGAIMVGNRYGGTGSENLEFIKFMPIKAAFSNTSDAGQIEDYDYTKITPNQWHHYAMVKTGNSYQWYVDGIAQGSPVTINYNETTPIPFNIGGDDDNETPGGRENEHFEGFIDDVVLYDRALSAREIQNLGAGIYISPPTTAQEDWRMLHFGTLENTGTAADSYDVNFDGELNLMEFATGQDPRANNLVSTPIEMNGGDLDFSYTRSKAALNSGVSFIVEWSDTLLPDSWSTAGVVDAIDSENPGDSEIENRVATVPEGSTGKRFVRLRVLQL